MSIMLKNTGRRNVLTKTEIKYIIRSARDPYRTIFIITSQTGKRISEVLNLRLADINFEEQLITWNILKRRKKHVITKAYDNPALFEAIKKYALGARVNDEDFLFKSYGKHGRLTRQSVHLYLNQLGAYNVHQLRHSVGHRLAEQGYTAFDIKQFLDHSSVMTTEHYLHTSGKRQKRVTHHARVDW